MVNYRQRKCEECGAFFLVSPTDRHKRFYSCEKCRAPVRKKHARQQPAIISPHVLSVLERHVSVDVQVRHKHNTGRELKSNVGIWIKRYGG